MQMCYQIPIGGIIDLVRMIKLVDRACDRRHLAHKAGQHLIRHLIIFGDMLLTRNNAAARIFLIAEEENVGMRKLADFFHQRCLTLILRAVKA